VLPLELQPKLLQKDVGAVTINVPLEKILSQLARGTVHLTYGELRQLAPYAFSREMDRDKTLVALPLGEILARVNPELLARRRTQRQIQVPAEIVSPFESPNNSLTFSVGVPKAEPAPSPTIAPRQTTPSSQISPAPISMPGRVSLNSTKTPPPPAAEPLVAARPIPATRAIESLAVSPPPPAPTPAHQNGKSTIKGEVLTLALTALAEGMPEAVRKEIVQLNLVDSTIKLPVEVIEQSLKQGRIAFSWKTLRSWIEGGALPGASPQDSTIVELPLKVVAPLFLNMKREAAKGQQKVSIDAEIPNLFFGFPQADPGTGKSGAVTKPVDTNYYVWDDNSDTARVSQDEAKRSQPSAGTRFISRCATPNEVVSRAGVLEGVAGALIALPDGLMVASALSADLNGETIAAFLPQIFGKVTQCTKELRMGELNNLNFTVGNVPWKIFRVNAIFFAVFGKPGMPLPGGQLAALAAELDHRAK
jgi:predicted regulator of Ras-like GTPase activity (Roadblock/LC7/MglB family)